MNRWLGRPVRRRGRAWRIALRAVAPAVTAAVLVFAPSTIGPGLARPPSGPAGASNVARLTLVSKSPGTFVEQWPAPFGRIKYASIYEGAFSAQLTLHRVARSTWYLVTLQRPSGESTGPNPFTGSNCVFGAAQGPGFGLDGWCDVALVKTNRGGHAHAEIPASTVALAPGAYADMTVAVKNVGCNADCSGPDAALLASGGSGELYESEPMAFTLE